MSRVMKVKLDENLNFILLNQHHLDPCQMGISRLNAQKSGGNVG